jgi:hypothetical protein
MFSDQLYEIYYIQVRDVLLRLVPHKVLSLFRVISFEDDSNLGLMSTFDALLKWVDYRVNAKERLASLPLFGVHHNPRLCAVHSVPIKQFSVFMKTCRWIMFLPGLD